MNIDRVVLTDTAKSKCFRMLSQGALKEIVRNKSPARQESEDKYILRGSYQHRTKGHNVSVEVVVAVKEEDGEKLGIVITQKHKHH